MSQTLILNAAEGLLQIALLRENPDLPAKPEVLCWQEWPAPTRSTEILAPALAHIWEETGTRCADVGRIACVYGPGSFTGIRLVLGTAAALRRVLGAPVAGLDYLHALALSAALSLQAAPAPAALQLQLQPQIGAQPQLGAQPQIQPQPRAQAQARPQGPDDAAAEADVEADLAGLRVPQVPQVPQVPRVLWVLTHARRDLAHCQPFSLKASLPQPLEDVALYPLEECARRINDQYPKAQSLCLGSSLWRNGEFFAAHCPQALVLGAAHNQPSCAALSLLAAQAHYAAEDIEPLYVRPCDAVENLPAMAARQGRDAHEAQQRLAHLLQRPVEPDAVYDGKESA